MPEEERPAAAIGHVTLRVQDVGRSCAFYELLGLRSISKQEALAILELRGGTHLLLFQAETKPKQGPIRSFDMMVDNAAKHREMLLAQNVPVSSLRHDRRSGHQMFEVADPDGHILTILSDHTEGRVV